MVYCACGGSLMRYSGVLSGVVWSGVDFCGVVCYFCNLVSSGLDLSTTVSLFTFLGTWI